MKTKNLTIKFCSTLVCQSEEDKKVVKLYINKALAFMLRPQETLRFEAHAGLKFSYRGKVSLLILPYELI